MAGGPSFDGLPAKYAICELHRERAFTPRLTGVQRRQRRLSACSQLAMGAGSSKTPEAIQWLLARTQVPQQS